MEPVWLAGRQACSLARLQAGRRVSAAAARVCAISIGLLCFRGLCKHPAAAFALASRPLAPAIQPAPMPAAAAGAGAAAAGFSLVRSRAHSHWFGTENWSAPRRAALSRVRRAPGRALAAATQPGSFVWRPECVLLWPPLPGRRPGSGAGWRGR